VLHNIQKEVNEMITSPVADRRTVESVAAPEVNFSEIEPIVGADDLNNPVGIEIYHESAATRQALKRSIAKSSFAR
jgi:hypothetical protein